MQMDRHFWLSSGARIEWVRPSCSLRSAVDFFHLVQGQLARRSGEIDVSLTAFSCVNMNQTPDWATVRDNQYGGMQAEEARRLARLEKENARFKMLLAVAELETANLKASLRCEAHLAAPRFIRSDNGPGISTAAQKPGGYAQALRDWCDATGTTSAASIGPGSPWENGFAELLY